ncbi:hypothetical protein QJS10_CPA02g00578 [Acorus calamus]|uniref:Uncharacterized protein n=1 Tax=Acorus calamus TaxID=4465 RepID=A0AAV9FBZ3_ACOCL|nr:hypothetical protein QJS10_CPA02g00578 [Acorus calamus]
MEETTPMSLLSRPIHSDFENRDQIIMEEFQQESLGCVRKNYQELTSLNQWVVRDYRRLVDSVNALERRMQYLSDDQVRHL